MELAGAAAIVLVLLVPTTTVGAGLGAPPTPRDAAWSGFGPMPAPAIRNGTFVNGSTVGTLDLLNGTVLPGLVAGANPARPLAEAYDADNETMWIAAGSDVGAFDVATGAGLAWVPVGAGADALVWQNATNTIIATAETSGTVVFVNASTRSVVRTSTGLDAPDGLAYDWANDSLFVAESGNASVAILNASSGAYERTVAVGKHPVGVAYDPTDERVLVANSQSKNISFLSTLNDSAYRNLTISGSTPTNLLFDGSNDRAYVSGDGNGIGEIDPATYTLASTIHAGLSDNGIGLSADNATLFVTDVATGDVYPVSTASNIPGVAFYDGSQSNPSAVAYASSQASVWVANAPIGGTTISNVTVASDSSGSYKVSGSVPIQHFPSAILPVPARHSVYLYDGGSGDLLELNATTFAENRSVFVGYSPGGVALAGGLAYDPSTDRLYVAESGTSPAEVVVVSASSFNVLGDALVGSGPGSLVLDASDGLLFSVNHGSNNVSAIDLSTDKARAIAVGDAPTSETFDPATGMLFVTNSASENVTVINASRLATVANVTVGNDPIASALDAGRGVVLVANAGSDNLTLLEGANGSFVRSVALASTMAPTGLAEDPANGTIEVPEWTLGSPNGSLELLNETNLSFAASINVTAEPAAVAFDPSAGLTLLAGEPYGTVSLVDQRSYPGLSVVSFSVPFPSINLGDPTSFTVVTTGGVAPFHYAYGGLPAGCIGNDSSFLACTPNATGAFNVFVNVTDANGETAGANTSLTVLPPPPPALAVNLSAAPANVTVGNASTITANATGGEPPYAYWYTVLPAGCVSANASSIVCRPTAAGDTRIEVRVNDSGGNISTATAWLNVTAAIPPLTISSFTASPPDFELGGTTDLAVVASGGVTPYTYAYGGLPGGCTSQDAASFDCDPLAVGVSNVTVTVTDARGATAHASVTLNVTPVPVRSHGTSNSSGSGLTDAEIGGIVLVVAVVVAIVGLVVWRARRAGGGERPPAP